MIKFTITVEALGRVDEISTQRLVNIVDLKYVCVVAKVNWRLMYTLAPNFEANVYISPKLQTSRLMCTLAPNFEANVYIRPKLQTWRLK